MKRRGFLKSSSQAILGAPFLFNPQHFIFNRTLGSPIVSILDSQASTLYASPGTVPNNDEVIVDLINGFTVNRIRVANMMDTAVMRFTGRSTPGKAWEALFPQGHPNMDTKISIKLNLSYGEVMEKNDWNSTICPFGPKVALSDAIIHGLTQMLEGHFPAENITIFDTIYSSGSRKNYPLVQGYRPVKGDQNAFYIDRTKGTYGIHWINPYNKLEIPDDAPEFTAAPEFSKRYQAHQRVKPAVYENDFMINVAIAKDHREAGVTGVMKNNYGCTDNPMGTHGKTWMRRNSPYPGTRLCVPAFYQALDALTPCILNVMDAIVGVYHGGPLAGKVFHTNTLTVSKDPLAMDTYLLNLINSFRQKNGYVAISTKDGRNADGHLNASFLRITEERYQIGSVTQNNRSSFDISDQPEKYYLPTFEKPQSRVSDAINTKGAIQMQVFMDNSQRQHKIRSWLEDVEGNIIQNFKSQTTQSNYTKMDWNPRLSRKEIAEKPRFVWHTEVDGIRHARNVNF